MKMLSKVLAVAVMVSFSGCFNHVYRVGAGAAISTTPRYSQWHHHFLFGLIKGTADVDVSAICPSGNATVTNNHSFINQLLAYIALGGWIWTPTTVEVYCNDARVEGEQAPAQPTAALTAPATTATP